jgi:hypothetical protein
MDYGFAPGTSVYESYLREMLTNRANTTLISKQGLTSVADFLGELVAESVTVDDLVPGSHASDEGFLFLALDSTTTALPVDYEALEAVNTSGTIQIPASITGTTTNLRFKGCRIGSDDAKPFLELLKKALGNPDSVTAPKYFHGLLEHNGIFEYMFYGYTVANKTPYPDRASLIAAFVAQAFTQGLDGTPVPDANWSAWLKPSLDLKPANAHKVKFNFPVTITPKSGGLAARPTLKAQCRSRAERFTYTYTLTGGTFPTASADRVALIKTQLAADPHMQSTHPYPWYARLHFADFDTFWDGLDWQATVNGSDLVGVGTHYVYTCVIPILVPGTTTSALLFNFYPASGTPLINFDETNTTYDMFGVV